MGEQPDFVEIRRLYDTRLTPGQRAEIRRAATPDDAAVVFATGRSFSRYLGPWESSYRVVWFLPVAGHRAQGETMGRQLARARVSEARVMQMLRSEGPGDLEHLRRLCRQIEPIVDWRDFGRALWWWSRADKQRIVEDYLWTKGGSTDE